MDGGNTIRLTFIVIFLFCSACATDWSRRDSILQAGLAVTMIADAITTARIKDHPELRETGFLAEYILGEQPEQAETYLYFGTLIVSYYIISRTLPSKWRPYFQIGSTIYFADLVINNCQIGLC